MKSDMNDTAPEVEQYCELAQRTANYKHIYNECITFSKGISAIAIQKKAPSGGRWGNLIDYGMICSLVNSRTSATLKGKSVVKMENRGDSGRKVSFGNKTG